MKENTLYLVIHTNKGDFKPSLNFNPGNIVVGTGREGSYEKWHYYLDEDDNTELLYPNEVFEIGTI